MKENSLKGISASFYKYKKTLNIIRLKVSLLLICPLSLYADTSYSQQARISLNLQNVTVGQVLKEIGKKSEFSFWYKNIDFKDDQKISLSVKNQTIGKILDIALQNQNLTYEIKNKVILIYKRTQEDSNLTQQLKIISKVTDVGIVGKVTDAISGEPLPGVNIAVEGTTLHTATDADGNYKLTVPQKNSVLVFSFMGYNTEKIQLSGQTVINIKMSADIAKLDEVVVVGYGTQKKSDMTGSVVSIGNEKFANQRVTRIDQILQGRASGVLVTSNSGAPGGESKVRIRGANSALGNNDPLYVVDGFVGADYNMVNPNDIASLEVLKDASSTAIYGSRGSNGVIIITTKVGKKGKLNVNYLGGVTLSKVIGTMPLLNAADFATIVNERNEALDQNPTFTIDQINSYKQNGGTDWQKEIYRQTVGTEHQLGLSGGADKTSFLVSANYLDQPGVIKNSGFKRYTLRSNLNTQFNDKLSFRLNITGANTANMNNLIRQGATTNPSVQALTWAPTTPIYDSNGNYTLSDPISSVKANPLALIYDQENRFENTFGNIVGGLRYEFIKGLSLDVQYVVDYRALTTKAFSGNYASSFNPIASINNAQEVTLQNTNTLNYNRTVNKIHKLNATVVFETQQFKGNYSGASASGLKFPELKYDNLSQAASFNALSNFSKWTLLSFLGRVNYTLKDRYLLSVSIRRDGSSKFYGDNKFSTFSAAALGWNITQEDFMKNVELFSKLKLRASWGLTGSQAIQPYATLSPYNNITYAFDNNSITSGIQLGNQGNTDLKWETTEQKDLGLEMGFFDGRLNAEFDYFIKNTTDLLLNRPIPGYLGGGEITSNVGEIQNKGWDFTIGGSIINSQNISWQSDFNISKIKNRVVSLGGIADMIFTGQNTTGISPLSEFVLKPGESLGSFWGLKYLGTWKPSEAAEAAKYGNVPGDARYEDLDGNHSIESGDYQIIGSGLPKVTAGWNNTIRYKDFTLNFFFQGVFGANKFNYSRGMTLVGERDARQVTSADIKDRYIPGVNETSDIPAFSKTSKILPQSTMFMEKGDFVRLKNLSLSYNLPKTLIRGINNIKVSVLATNLITFTKYKGIDPETSSIGSATDQNQGIDYGSYPNAKSFIFNVSISL
jgi:TonB-linked SusC/RagA family outer membrane protein